MFEDPIECANHVISTVGLNTLKFYLRDDVEIRVGWASVYGFEPDQGLPNYDPDTDGLLVDVSTGAKPAEILERWRPYQVINPFVFLTIGDSAGLKAMPPLGSGVIGVQRPEFIKQMEPRVSRLRSSLRPIRNWFHMLVEFVR